MTSSLLEHAVATRERAPTRRISFFIHGLSVWFRGYGRRFDIGSVHHENGVRRGRAQALWSVFFALQRIESRGRAT
jgi:hypothetical protein